VEVTEFVPLTAIDPVSCDKADYLAPDKGGAEPYSLFVEAMRKTGRSALGRYAARGKQYIVLLHPADDVLITQQLPYVDEVRAVDDLVIPVTEVRESEPKLAIQLIEQISSEAFHPEAYEDAVKQRIETAIQRKVEGKEISLSDAPPETGGGAQIIDLMAAAARESRQGQGQSDGRRSGGGGAGTQAPEARGRAR
jgi:DNA end-binding protein Ku